MKTKFKVGDMVYVDGYIGASMAQQNAHMDKVTEVATRYNGITGKPFQIVKVGDDWYKEDGICYSRESMYYIEKYDEEKEKEAKERLEKERKELEEKRKKYKRSQYDPTTFELVFFDDDGKIVE